MKRKVLLFFLILWNIGLIFGQVDENKNFIYSFSDSVIYGRIIEYKTPFLGSSHFLVDSKKIQPDLVKFYRNETGFYANTKTVNFSGTSSFTERIRKGRINLYEKETTTYSPGHFNSTTGMYSGGMTTSLITDSLVRILIVSLPIYSELFALELSTPLMKYSNQTS